MSISFGQWRRDQRLKFQADLRALERRHRAASWRRTLRTSRSILAGLALAAGVGVAIGIAMDGLEHRPAEAERRGPNLGRIGVTATVVDGDTLRLGSERIRLHGIDAPESRQRCADGWWAGAAAKTALADLVAAGAPACEKITTDRYGRTVAVCRVNGQDLGREMVRRGLAWAYARYSPRYLPEEGLARLERCPCPGLSVTRGLAS